jgi:nucleoside-diphosphate-sugar epimerase
MKKQTILVTGGSGLVGKAIQDIIGKSENNASGNEWIVRI